MSGEYGSGSSDLPGQSRIIGGRFRQAPPRNEATMCFSLDGIAPGHGATHGCYDAKKLFIAKFAAIHDRMKRFAHAPGVLVLAFDADKKPVAEGWVKASRRRPRALILGRHSQCDVRVDPSAAQVALRHLALMVRQTGLGLRCRMLDLHTGTRFSDEGGRDLESVTFDGTAFFALHGLALMVLETGSGDLSTDPEEAYAQLPARRLIDSGEQVHDAMWPARRSGIDGETWIYSQQGPLAIHNELSSTGDLVGRLSWFDGRDVQSQVLSSSALARGVLFGRSSKCQLRLDQANALSRVHLLLIEDGGRVLAIDTASTNGTFVSGHPISLVRLEPGMLLDLCDLSLTWDWAQ